LGEGLTTWSYGRDPADRIILSTARTLGAAVVTRDERLWSCPHVETVW
jgi:PIN domain nuclease of toxin-antitoxin system